jgi:eukaryotic-like serine/threonine-protein kinase
MNEPETCPSEDVFVQFLSGRLPREGVSLLERHAACCASCLDLISGAVELVTPPLGSVGDAGLPPAQNHTDAEEESRANVLRFGPFRVVAVLGRGGIGVVYRAVDDRTGEEVAIKTVQPSRREALLSLHREIHALSQIRHPGVVRIIARGDRGPEGDEEVGWYAMQLVEGQTLAERLATCRKTTTGRDPAALAGRNALLEILRRLCSTLTVLHAAGLVHRDLSPRNVIIRPDGTPVLVDFGFALTNAGVTGDRDVLQIDTLQAGTLLYTAPEQFLGEPSDARSDLYSLGCILYEVLAGRPPFRGQDARSIIDAHLTTAPRPPSQLAPQVVPEMDQLVLMLLAKRPSQRPAYADEVGRALSQLGVPGAGSTPQPVPASPGYLYRPSLVGRKAPLAELERLLEGCERGRGARVFITGESGAGKTRLAVELASRAHRQGMQVVLGTSAGPTLDVRDGGDARSAVSALQPLRPFLQAVAEYCRTHGRQESLRVLGPRGRLLAAYEPALSQAPGMAELPRLPPLLGDGARFRLFDALEHMLVALSSRRPVVLIIDDLQWADELTRSFVCERLGADFFARHEVLIAATCRDEELPPDLRRTLADPAVARLSLSPLDAGAVGRMIDEMLGSQPAPQTLTASVASHACGNPLFVVEYLRTALSEQRLVRSEASWRLKADPPAEPGPAVPLAVRELVLRRLARLSTKAQFLVELAAVLGREFPLEQLLATAGGTFSPAQPALDASLGVLAELVINQVLEAGESGQYRFVHDKLREITYEKIPPARRRSHHAQAASAIERGRAGDPDFGRHYAALAVHHGAARDDRRALVYLERAAGRALRSGTAREAVALCTRGIELAARVGLPRRAKLYRLRAEAHFALADLDACRDDASAVIEEVCGHVPASRGRWIRLLLAQVARQVVHRLAPARWWKSPSRSRPARAEAAVAAGLLASVHYFTGQWLSMFATLVLGTNLAESANHGAEVIGAFARLGYVSGVAHSKRLAATFFGKSMRLARSRDDMPALALALYLHALHDLGQGRFAAVEETGTQALQLLEQVGDAQAGAITRTIVGHAMFFQGRLEETAQWYGELHESARRRANHQHMGWGLALQARSLILLGRAAQAAPLLEEARLLLAPLADRLSIVMCEGLLASAYLASGRLDDARRVAATLTPRLRGAPMPLAACIHGYTGSAAVALALWRSGGTPDGEGRRAARLATRRLWRFARMFPLARPAALAMSAAFAAQEGDGDRAARLCGLARQKAHALGLSVDCLETPLALALRPAAI